MRRRPLLALAIAVALSGPAFGQTVQTAPPTPTPPDLGKTIRVVLETGDGPITLELYPDRAPITVANFLHYVDTKRFNGAKFFRAARAKGYPQLGLVQGGGLTDASKLYKPITLEPTSQTGLHHHDGTISMARDKPNSAQADFFIIIGGGDYLDANPAAPGDNQGFAAFGQVVDGMDAVKKILAEPTEGHARNPTMQGQILTDPVPITSAHRAQ